MSRITPSLLLLVALCGCSAGHRDVDLPSPDGTKVIRTSKAEGTHLVVSVFDRAGNLLHQENTRATRLHRWSVEWISGSKVIIRTSDIGPLALTERPDGSWTREDPLKKLSPDGKLIAYTFWNRHREKCLTLSIGKPLGDDGSIISVLREFETQIVVSNLEDSARWEGNDRIVVVADSGEHVWHRDSEGTWRHVDE